MVLQTLQRRLLGRRFHLQFGPNRPRGVKRAYTKWSLRILGRGPCLGPIEIKIRWNVHFGMPSLARIPSPYNLTCNLWDKDWVWENMVPKNMKLGLIGDNYDGASTLGLLVLSYCFRLGSHDCNCLQNLYLLGDGVGNCCCKRPTYKLPIIGNISFFGAKLENGC
jgi:hypothetical protein